MSASRRAPKTRYVITSDRDRIALVAGAMCGFVVLLISIFVQQHPLLVTVFRAMVAVLVTYVTVYLAVLLVVHLRDTQSVVQDAALEEEVEEPETE